MSGLRVLISGAGVAGPALAYRLARYGAGTTVVEAAPALRTSGFAVDFRGSTHMSVLSKMGVLEELRSLQTHGGAMRCVDEHGRRIFELPAEFAGDDVEVLRRAPHRVRARARPCTAPRLLQQKKLIADAFTGMRRHVPYLLTGLRQAPKVYFDSISRVRVPAWSSGRAALRTKSMATDAGLPEYASA
ncbi:FAD-dependent monooxygenase [Actinoallomurus iriomotensis]|uniref:FAD-dependent monooxygenase n=1 Tax=Actinoallomurus iriomotensis TaxID=478107 RepID=UPI0025572512|nr:FAD-dependent monooxygenase [Actinoallomurus iriomotensis]